MHNVGIVGNSTRASSFLRAVIAALAISYGETVEHLVPGKTRGPGANRSSRIWHKGRQVKTDWPGQTEAQRDQYLAAAQAKRERKSALLTSHATKSFGSNYAHWSRRDRKMGNLPKSFDPFCVAH